MTPRKGKLPAVLACMASLAGCNINPANQGSVSSWFSMRAGDPPSFVTGVVGFENPGSNDPSTRLTLRFRDPASKTHAAHVTTSSYSELFSLALTPRYYELYEFEVRYLSYTVTRETGAYEERCEANGEALEKTVQKRKRSVTHTAVNVESNCRSTPLTKTDYYYETYTSKPFSAPFRAESFATNYIGDFRVQCSYKEKKGKTLVDSCRLNARHRSMASSSQASSKAVHTAGAGLSRLPWQTGATSSKNNRSSNAGSTPFIRRAISSGSRRVSTKASDSAWRSRRRWLGSRAMAGMGSQAGAQAA